MRRIFYFSISALLFSATKTKAQQWSLVWSDEFSNAVINTSNWDFDTGAGGWGNGELENYTNRIDNATIYNGNLILIGKNELYQGSNYTSARIKTQSKHSWTYGKVEAKIKIPVCKGLWSAFWMLGDNINTVSWPACGEIDIMEHVNTDNTNYGTMHWDSNGAASYGGDTVLNNINQYHIYSVEWDSSAINWLVDGNKYWSGNILNNVNSTEEFHKPFFIILNMAIGGNWPGSPDGTTVFPDTMFVDYVRVYQKQTSTSTNNYVSTKQMVRVFPNPAGETSTLFIDCKKNEEFQIEIHDLFGKISFQKKVLSTSNDNIVLPLSLGDLKTGIYFLSVQGTAVSTCMKLIKQ